MGEMTTAGPAGGTPGGPAPRVAATLVGTLAAAGVGAVLAAALPALLVPTAFNDLVRGAPLRSGVLAPVALAVAVAATVMLRRVGGWPLALAGLLLATVADRFAELPLVTPVDTPSTPGVLGFLLGAVGVGLALGGALLAIGQAAGGAGLLAADRADEGAGSLAVGRVDGGAGLLGVGRFAGAAVAPLAGGLAAGLVTEPVYAALVRSALPTPSPVQPFQVQLWLALAVTAGAALLAYRGRGARPVVGAWWWGPVVAVAVAGLLVLGGLLVRWWVIREFRLSPDGLASSRRETAVAAFAHHSAVAIAVVAALVLLGYAHRALGVVGARWMVLAFAVAPIRLVGWPLDLAAAPGRVLLVAVTGLAAVAVGVTLARHAAGLLPWDALGVAVAAVALPLSAHPVREELPSAVTVGPVLVALGSGLALGFGLAAVVTRFPADHRPAGGSRPVAPTDRRRAGYDGQGTPAGGADPGWSAAVLVVGFATWALTAQALSPILARSIQYGRTDLSLTFPVLALTGAVVLALLFAVARVVDRFRHDLATPPPPAGGPPAAGPPAAMPPAVGQPPAAAPPAVGQPPAAGPASAAPPAADPTPGDGPPPEAGR